MCINLQSLCHIEPNRLPIPVPFYSQKLAGTKVLTYGRWDACCMNSTSEDLFQCRGDIEHMWMIEFVLGIMPKDIIKKSKLYDNFFSKDGHILSNSLDLVKLKKRLMIYEMLLRNKTKDDEQLIDLIMHCLRYYPNERIKPQAALSLPFFDKRHLPNTTQQNQTGTSIPTSTPACAATTA